MAQILGKSGTKKSLEQKEIEKTLRTGNVPIKLVLQEKGPAISRSTNTTEFIIVLEEQNISLTSKQETIQLYYRLMERRKRKG